MGSRGWQSQAEMYFYYTNRGAHIYLAPGSNNPCSATVICFSIAKYSILYMLLKAIYFIYLFISCFLWILCLLLFRYLLYSVMLSV